MDRIGLSGAAGPTGSFELDGLLQPLTSKLRPAVTVDLSLVSELHPSVVSVIIRHQRQARRQGGDLVLVRPKDPEAARMLDHVGLVGAESPCARS